MKVIKTITLLLLLQILLSGCLQVETNVLVNKDGSGTITEKVLMSKTFVSMMREFAQSFQDSSSTEEFSLFSEDEIKNNAKGYGEDIEYVSHEFIGDENWEGYNAVFSFDDVTKIKLYPDPDNKVEIGMAEKTPEEEDYYFFRFIKGDRPELIIDRPEIELNPESGNEVESSVEEENIEEESGDEYLQLMEGMKINISVEVEGKIVNTNANYVENSKVTLMHMDLGEMMKNKGEFKKFKNKEPKNIDEMKVFMEKFPGMKLEIQKPVTIKFQ
jgi:hypothetical protein